MRVYPDPGVRSVIHQDAHHRVIAPQDGMAQSRAVHEFRPLLQHCAKQGEFAVPGRLPRTADDRDTVHKGFQFRPAVKAIRAREDELRVGCDSR